MGIKLRTRRQVVWERVEVGQSWVQENGHTGPDTCADAVPNTSTTNAFSYSCVDAAAHSALDTTASSNVLPNTKSNSQAGPCNHGANPAANVAIERRRAQRKARLGAQ